MKRTIEFTEKFRRKTALRRTCRHIAVICSFAASAASSQVTYSAGWSEQVVSGPWGDKLHTSSTVNATATINDTGTEAFVIHRTGPQCGIFQVVVDGDQATMKEIDAYSAEELWNRKTVVASNLTKGPHTIVVTVTGRKNTKASSTSIQIVDKWTLGRGMWSPEKAWTWYKSRPQIVGWNYVPSTCVNTVEWWQDEKKVTDSIIHRELGLGEQLGYNSIIVYLQYIVWLQDSAYHKERFRKFLDLADQHHFTVSPIFFDDVNFVCSGVDCPNARLGDQGEPDPGKLMSQWTASPGPKLVLSVDERPKFKRYVQDFVRTFGQDKRILMWNLYNEPSNSGLGTRTFSLVELAFIWAREVGPSQPLTVSEWSSQTNPWPYNLSDIASFHGYMNNAGLIGRINSLRVSQRPIICTEWLARGNPGTDVAKDLPLFKRLGVGHFCWSLINGRMHCERSWTSFGSYNDPWFHDVLYNSGKPYRADEVDALRKNLAHKTFNWAAAGTSDGPMTVKNGCTDPRYSQYDSTATIDNGSCSSLLPALVVKGCTDPNSKNYNPLATQSDPAMCNAVGTIGPYKSVPVKPSHSGLVRYLGNNRIGITGHEAVQVLVYDMVGRVVWSASVDEPGVFDMGKFLGSGIYYSRTLNSNGAVAASGTFIIGSTR
jgi:hypothetical protein